MGSVRDKFTGPSDKNNIPAGMTNGQDAMTVHATVDDSYQMSLQPRRWSHQGQAPSCHIQPRGGRPQHLISQACLHTSIQSRWELTDSHGWVMAVQTSQLHPTVNHKHKIAARLASCAAMTGSEPVSQCRKAGRRPQADSGPSPVVSRLSPLQADPANHAWQALQVAHRPLRFLLTQLSQLYYNCKLQCFQIIIHE